MAAIYTAVLAPFRVRVYLSPFRLMRKTPHHPTCGPFQLVGHLPSRLAQDAIKLETLFGSMDLALLAFLLMDSTRGKNGIQPGEHMQGIIFHIWFAVVFILQGFCLSGRLAEVVHRSWKNTPFESYILPGRMVDLAYLKRLYFWFGLITLPLTCLMYGMAWIHRN